MRWMPYRRNYAIAVIFLAIGPIGCTAMDMHPTPAPVTEPQHPIVKIEGSDGTILKGELLNGSVNVDCGQGELTLLTDHIYLMTFDKEGDSVMSESVKVLGKVQETEFRLRNEHGVFKLLKQNLRSIQFASAPTSATSPPTRYAPATPAP